MSYNTRRSNNANSIDSIGQRRPQPPQIGNSFVQGGQLKPVQQPLIKMANTQQQQQQPQQSQETATAIKKEAQSPTPLRKPGQPAVVVAATPPAAPAAVAAAAPKPTVQSAAAKQPPTVQSALQAKAEQIIKDLKGEAAMAVAGGKVPVAPPAPVVSTPPVAAGDEPAADTSMEVETAGAAAVDTDEERKQRFRAWKTGKISKAERMRRRNTRFRRILQPKNALMILNELNGSTTYTFTELANGSANAKGAPIVFKAATIVEGVEYAGTGGDKTAAKSAAAEAAIRSIIMRKIASSSSISTDLTTAIKKEEDGGSASNTTTAPGAMITDEGSVDGDTAAAMDEDDDSLAGGTDGKMTTDEVVPWTHIASFALHKLFSTWDDAGLLLRSSSMANLSPGNSKKNESMDAALGCEPVATVIKPAKQLPEGAVDMHPVMLLNQMRPGTTYKEGPTTGTPPQILFSFETMVDDRKFIGQGPNKKLARRNAAYQACQGVLNIVYSAEVMEDIKKSSMPRSLNLPSVEAASLKPPGGGVAPQQQNKGNNNMGGNMGNMQPLMDKGYNQYNYW